MIGLAHASNIAIYGAMAALTVAMFAFALSWSAGRRRGSEGDPGRRAANVGMSLTWLSFGLLFLGVVLRGLWAGRAPWGNMYEFAITASLVILGLFLAMSLRMDVRWLGIFVVIPVLLTLGLAITVLYSESAQLVPALRSYWLVIHVSAAIICVATFTVAAALSALAIIKSFAQRRAVSRGTDPAAVLARVPEVERLRMITYRIVAFSFPLWTFVVVAGAIWAEVAWGRYWGWDPKETWAFITWVLYAAYLHALSTKGWSGDRASWIAIAGWMSFVFNFLGVNLFFTSLHSYAGVG